MTNHYRLVEPPKSFETPIVYDGFVVIERDGKKFVMRETDGVDELPRIYLEVTECSQAFVDYLKKRDEMYTARVAAGGYYSEAENPIIADMDYLWSTIEDSELAFIRAQASWKFAQFPNVVVG